jgi:phosphomannomutase
MQHPDSREQPLAGMHVPDDVCKSAGSCRSILQSNRARHNCSCMQHPESRNKPLKGMHVLVDAGNGAGGFFASEVLAPLGADTSGSQFLEPDGTFPNHVPNPEDEAAMSATIDAGAFDELDMLHAILILPPHHV